MIFPGNFFYAAYHENQIRELRAFLAGVADHFVGNVHAYYPAFVRGAGQDSREPACAAAGVQDVVGGGDLHAREHWLGDWAVLVLHGLALTGFGPAIEFFS